VQASRAITAEKISAAGDFGHESPNVSSKSGVSLSLLLGAEEGEAANGTAIGLAERMNKSFLRRLSIEKQLAPPANRHRHNKTIKEFLRFFIKEMCCS